MKGKALIKETGEILDIKQKYQKMNMTFDISMFPDELKDELKGFEKEVWVREPDDSNIRINSSEDYYILSDGEKYTDKEVIVGVDNIREWKLKNIIK